MAIELLRPDLDKSSVDSYANGLFTEFDKLYVALSRDGSLESQAQAELAQKLRNYIRITQVYPSKPDEEIPPRDEENPK